MLTLGAFEMGPVVGNGAFAHVRQGRHPGTGIPVALKIFDRRETDSQSFEAELRVQASLVHRDVLMVLDGGLADADEGGLNEGTPYMVLEWASGGSATVEAFQSWEEARRLLTTLLSALAGAHAAGLIHRDVKLPNLLRCTSADLRPGFKLADFGIAMTRGARAARAGTPLTMAPEQILGNSHEIGPWTDLYATGCVAFQLVTGRPVVPATNLDIALDAHLRGITHPFTPRFAVPAGLASWIADLRCIDPFARPDRAVDALRALDRLEGSMEGPSDIPVALAVGFEEQETVRLSDPPPRASAPVEAVAVRRFAPGAERWHEENVSVPRGLLASGARLARLRRGQPLGREAAQAQLWSALDVPEGELRLVWLRGPGGIGRSQLLSWFGARAHELGRADLLTVEGAWLRHALGYPPADVVTYLSRSMPGSTPEQRIDLRWLLDASPLPGNALRRFAEARHGRPLVVLVDDAPGRLGVLDQVQSLVRPKGVGPGVLVVATASDDDELGGWAALPSWAEVRLGPLSSAELESALVERLGLNVADATRAVAGSGGLPRDAFDAAMVAHPAARRGSARLLRRMPQAEQMLAVAAVLQGDGTVGVAAWFERVKELLPGAFGGFPELVDRLLDGGFAHVVGSDLRIDPALLQQVHVPQDIVRSVALGLAPPSRVRALAIHGLPQEALAAATAHASHYGTDADARMLDGLDRVTRALDGIDGAQAQLLLARMLASRGDLVAALERIEAAAPALEGSSIGWIELCQARMHRALLAGDYAEVERRFDDHRSLLDAHPERAAMTYLLVALVPQERVAGIAVAEAALRAEELASRAGQRTIKVEVRRLLAELSEARGREDLADSWLKAARRGARGSPCLPLFGAILAEARFALSRGDRERAKACLDEIGGMAAAPARPLVLAALQRAELAVVEERWDEVGAAVNETRRRARDLDWALVSSAADALAAGQLAEERRWDSAEHSVDAAAEVARHGQWLRAIALSLDHCADRADAHGMNVLAVRAVASANAHRSGK